MKQKRRILVILFLLSIWTLVVQAQETITSSGGNASGNGGSVSYTIGQVLYSFNSGSNGTVSQGVQQPFEISVVTGIPEAKDISLEIIVYPNPATDFVILNIKNYDVQKLRYQLYDNNGSLLQDNKVEGSETNIVMVNYVHAVYFLKVSDNNKVIKTFKIIKN